MQEWNIKKWRIFHSNHNNDNNHHRHRESPLCHRGTILFFSSFFLSFYSLPSLLYCYFSLPIIFFFIDLSTCLCIYKCVACMRVRECRVCRDTNWRRHLSTHRSFHVWLAMLMCRWLHRVIGGELCMVQDYCLAASRANTCSDVRSIVTTVHEE